MIVWKEILILKVFEKLENLKISKKKKYQCLHQSTHTHTHTHMFSCNYTLLLTERLSEWILLLSTKMFLKNVVSEIHLHNINIYRQTNQLKIDFLGFFLFCFSLNNNNRWFFFLSKVINDDNVVAVDNGTIDHRIWCFHCCCCCYRMWYRYNRYILLKNENDWLS